MILIASTTASWKCDGRSELAWLDNIEKMIASVEEEVRILAVLEVDARGLDPFKALLDRLAGLPAHVTTYSLDDGEAEVTTSNRLARICMGRNLIAEHAVERGAEWILHLDSDNTIKGDALAKLLDVDWPIVGGLTYVMSGPEVRTRPARIWLEGSDVWPRNHRMGQPFNYPVQQHWNGAGVLLVHRSLFRFLRWRHDPDAGMTDDPCYARDAEQMGWPTLVRHDVIARPTSAPVPVEQRNADRTIHR